MTGLVAYYKIDHTFCMNSNENNIEYNIDKEEYYGTEYEGKYDPCDTDCKSLEEAVDCLDIIKDDLDALTIIINKKVDLAEFWFLVKREGVLNANVFYNSQKHGSRCLTKEEFNKIYDSYKRNSTEKEDI